MAGDDEARARAVLDEMQLRISQGPHSALGLGEAVSPEEVRAAFLALTKQFHPARFGRMSGELQKLSNEVFLGIKEAHDQLLKGLGSTLRPTGSARRTGGMPALTAEGTSRTPAPRTTAGTRPPTTQLARGTDRSVSRKSAPVIAPNRVSTPPMGVPVQPRASSHSTASSSSRIPVQAPRSTGSIPVQGRPGTGPVATQRTTGSIPVQGRPATGPVARQRTTGSIPVQGRPGTGPVATQRTTGQVPAASRSGSFPAQSVQRTTHLGHAPLARPGTPPQQRPTTTPPYGRPGTPPAMPPRPAGDAYNPGTQRGVQPAQQTQPLRRVAVFDEQAALREAVVLLDARDWTAARQALHALAAKIPQSKHYRALLCYARGREGQAAGRTDDAMLEYQRALQLEPDLAKARQALAELQRRR